MRRPPRSSPVAARSAVVGVVPRLREGERLPDALPPSPEPLAVPSSPEPLGPPQSPEVPAWSTSHPI